VDVETPAFRATSKMVATTVAHAPLHRSRLGHHDAEDRDTS
jgi:hypothetical protein